MTSFPARWARERRGGAPAPPPTISIAGDVLIGETLTATHDGTSVQWLRDGSPISGATSSTYVVTSSDIGPEITCEATGPGGTTESDALVYDDATRLPRTAILAPSSGLTPEDGGTTAQALASAWGGASFTGSAPDGAQRPAYDDDGGPGGSPMLLFDGAGDVLVGTATWGHSWAAWRIDVVGYLEGAESVGDCIARYAPTSNSIDATVNGSSAIRLSTAGTGGGAIVGSTVLTGTPRLMSWVGISGASGSQRVEVNGEVENTMAITHAAWADGATLSIGANAIGGMATQLRLLAIAVTAIESADEPLSDEQRTHLVALLENLTGASLT